MPARNFTDHQESIIAGQYLEGMSSIQLAKLYQVDKLCILSALKRQGIERRTNETANRKYTINEYAFDQVTEDSAYWLGFLYADGNVNRNKVIRLGLSVQDRDHIQRFANFLQTDAPIKDRIMSLKGMQYSTVELVVTHKYLGQRLRTLGILPHRPDFNLALTFLTPEYYRHFIRGVFDGDGSATKVKCVSFSGNVDLLTWIRQTIANNTNSNPNLKVHKHIRANLHYLVYSFGRSTFPILDYLYKDTNLFLARKRDISSSWVPAQSPTRNELGRYQKRSLSTSFS